MDQNPANETLPPLPPNPLASGDDPDLCLLETLLSPDEPVLSPTEVPPDPVPKLDEISIGEVPEAPSLLKPHLVISQEEVTVPALDQETEKALSSARDWPMALTNGEATNLPPSR